MWQEIHIKSVKSCLLYETHFPAAAGVFIAIRVGHNLQVDVHPVEDGGESRVTAKISCDLNVSTQVPV